jgi:exopolysaccharide biosynthesis polyprenyl glycosylphosphotransferase
LAATSSVPPQAGRYANTRGRTARWLTRPLLTLALMGCDALAVNLALIAVYRWRLLENPELQALFNNSAPVLVPFFLVLLNSIFAATFAFNGLYTLKRGSSRVEEVFKLIAASSLALFSVTFVNILIALLPPQVSYDDMPANDRLLIPAAWVTVVAAVIISRLLYRNLLYLLRRAGIDTRKVLIVGAREPGIDVLTMMRRNPRLGYQVSGFLSTSVPVGQLVAGVPVLGRPAALGRVIRATQADEIVIALSGRASNDVLDLVALAENESIDIKLYPDAFQLVTNNGVSVGDVTGLPLISIRNSALDNPLNRALKRGLDIIVSVTVLTLLSPLMLLLAVLIKLESSGPAFFIHERVGLDGRPFAMIKFRGMRRDAPQLGEWTVKDDPRVTRLGRLLRRYSIDELPQFINVLRGEMSVVGPRPEQPMWVERFRKQIPRYMRRHRQKAGITGWAQINGLRGDSSIEERTRYDLYYVENWSLWFDITIIVQTTVGILTGKNAGY